MILSIRDRIYLPGLFAANFDSMTEAAVQRTIRKLIAIEQQEATDISLKLIADRYVWNAQKGLDKEFDFKPEQLSYLKESVFNLSRSKSHSVTQELLPLCEKILG